MTDLISLTFAVTPSTEEVLNLVNMKYSKQSSKHKVHNDTRHNPPVCSSLQPGERISLKQYDQWVTKSNNQI